MGFRFRRSLQVVPGVRLNLSRGGPSVSFGGRGLHYTIGPKGTRTTVGLPGTGLSWSAYKAHDTPAPVPQANMEIGTQRPNGGRTFTNADIANMAAASTIDLAQLLDSRRKQFPIHSLVPIVAATIAVLSAVYELQPLALGAVVIGALAWPAIFVIDRRRRTTTLNYNLSDAEKAKYDRLNAAFDLLISCRGLWGIPVEWKQEDWKRECRSDVDHSA